MNRLTMPNHIRHLMFLSLALTLAVITGCAAAASKDYRTYVIRPPINDDPILADEALPV